MPRNVNRGYWSPKVFLPFEEYDESEESWKETIDIFKDFGIVLISCVIAFWIGAFLIIFGLLPDNLWIE